MPIVSPKELKLALPKGKRLMGIDQSKKVLGLALSNPELTMAMPFRTIVRTKFSHDVHVLAGLCREYDVRGFVIGLPLNMDGTEGSRVDSVKHFADNLIKAKDVLGFDPLIAFTDERLSTSAAEDLLSEHTKMSRRERDNVVDQLAAQMILQAALEEMER